MSTPAVPCLIREVLFAPACPENVAKLLETALTHHNTSHFKLSIETYLKAQDELARVKKTLNVSELLFFRCSIGSVYESAGDDDFALAEYMEAKRYSEQHLDEKHPDRALAYSCVGTTYFHLSQFSLAKNYFEHALRIRKRLLGSDHVDTALVLNNLAACHQVEGRLSEAIDLFETSLRVIQTRLGENHPRCLLISRNLAKVKGISTNDFSFDIPPGIEATVTIPMVRAPVQANRGRGRRRRRGRGRGRGRGRRRNRN